MVYKPTTISGGPHLVDSMLDIGVSSEWWRKFGHFPTGPQQPGVSAPGPLLWLAVEVWGATWNPMISNIFGVFIVVGCWYWQFSTPIFPNDSGNTFSFFAGKKRDHISESSKITLEGLFLLVLQYVLWTQHCSKPSGATNCWRESGSPLKKYR